MTNPFSQNLDSRSGSLIVIGSGIKFLSHLTIEAKAHIEQAEKILYLVNEPAMQEWIQRQSTNAENLDFLYDKYPLRNQNYKNITDYIIKTVKKNLNVCVVLYGHPTVFAQPALDAVISLRKEGFNTEVLPGISAVDCLFADLLIDFGIRGCQLLDATDLLVNKRIPDVTTHLILWQVGVVGLLGNAENHDNSKNLPVLKNYLLNFYTEKHPIVLYEAAQYPTFKPKIETYILDELENINFSRISTLYIPPQANNNIDKTMLDKLGITFKDLC